MIKFISLHSWSLSTCWCSGRAWTRCHTVVSTSSLVGSCWTRCWAPCSSWFWTLNWLYCKTEEDQLGIDSWGLCSMIQCLWGRLTQTWQPLGQSWLLHILPDKSTWSSAVRTQSEAKWTHSSCPSWHRYPWSQSPVGYLHLEIGGRWRLCSSRPSSCRSSWPSGCTRSVGHLHMSCSSKRLDGCDRKRVSCDQQISAWYEQFPGCC